jgi:hypothetical protein
MLKDLPGRAGADAGDIARAGPIRAALRAAEVT